MTGTVVGTTYPSSFGQQRLWFLDQLQPGSPQYNVPAVLSLTGQLDVAALRAALDLVVARHDTLRTVFDERDGDAVQIVHEHGTAAMSIVDVAAEVDPAAAARALVEREARTPFDLRTGPLMRVLLVRTAADAHQLMFTLHHIMSDGWSLSILLAEVGTAYRAIVAGEEPRLPELTLRYPAYAAWQREQLDTKYGAAALDYWVQALTGGPVLLSLPTDRPRPAVRSPRGLVHGFDLSVGLTQDLRDLSMTTGGTLFMTLLAAYQALLSRYSGQDDVVVGTAVAGRSRVDAEPLIGFFVNTIPLRVSLAGNPSFRDLVGRVRDVALDGLGYSDVPLERVVEVLQPQRSLGHSPVFQAQLNLQSTPPPRLDLPGLTVTEPAFVFADTAKFDLTLGAVEAGNRLHVDLEYSTELFDADTAARIGQHYVRFIEAVVANPDLPIRDVPLLTAAETETALCGWNDTAAPLPAGTALDLIAERVRTRPDAVAVSDAGVELTYAELDAEANRIAHLLRAAGVGAEVRVGLCVTRSARMVVSLLGIWKAGGAYVPLDPRWPRERLRYMLADSEASVLLVDDETREHLSTTLDASALVCLDRDVDRIVEQPTTPPTGGPAADDLAYVIYTSGSTGRPKGVMVPHAGVVNQLVAFDALLRLSTEDVWAAVTTLSFDPSVLELLLPLTCGARVVVLDSDESADPVLLRGRLAEYGATVMQSTPSRWRMLLGAGGVPAGVRTRLCGGEALTPELAAALTADGAALWNIYGPTETTIWATATPVEADAATGEIGTVEIGPPIANTRVYVLDEKLRPVAVGEVGEIHIAGAGMTRGYQGRDDLTAAAFVADPFGAPGEKLYATGDLARYRPTGRLEFLGRADHQVKIRGLRIELGEIEAALRIHPKVAEAAVTATVIGDDDTRLAAYLVLRGEPMEPDALVAQVRPHLAERLPDYMVPAAFVLLDELPMTPTGKVDRAALPAADWDSLRQADRVPPRDAVERAIADIWAELLGVVEVGVHDDFFALGGHSLLVARMLARVRERFLIEAPMRSLFDARTVAAFAETLRGLEPTPGHLAEIVALRAEIDALPDDQVAALLSGVDGTT